MNKRIYLGKYGQHIADVAFTLIRHEADPSVGYLEDTYEIEDVVVLEFNNVLREHNPEYFCLLDAFAKDALDSLTPELLEELEMV